MRLPWNLFTTLPPCGSSRVAQRSRPRQARPHLSPLKTLLANAIGGAIVPPRPPLPDDESACQAVVSRGGACLRPVFSTHSPVCLIRQQSPSSVGFVEACSSVRRGEGGVERLGGPLWTQSGGLCGPPVPLYLVALPMRPRPKNLPLKVGASTSLQVTSAPWASGLPVVPSRSGRRKPGAGAPTASSGTLPPT
jgi:hypothetical protein